MGNLTRSVVFAALSFGLIMGASLLKLWDTGASVGGASDLAQWVQIGLLFALAWLFPRTALQANRFCALGCVALVGVFVAEYFYLVAMPNATLFDGILSVRGAFALMQGVSECAFLIVCARLFSELPPKHSSVAVSLGIALNMAILVLQPLLTTPQITTTRNVLLTAGALCAIAGVALLPEEPFPGTRQAMTGGDSTRVASDRPHEAPTTQGRTQPLGTSPADGIRISDTGNASFFALFVGCATALSFAFGFLRRYVLHYEVLTGSSDVTGQVILLLVALAAAAYAYVRGIAVHGDVVVFALCPLLASAFLIAALAPQGGLFAADMLAGIGYTMLRLLMWATVARVAYADPARLGTYAALAVLATTFGAQVGFEIAQVLAVTGASISLRTIALVALALCAACCLVMVPGYGRRRRVEDDMAAGLGGEPIPRGTAGMDEAEGGEEGKARFLALSGGEDGMRLLPYPSDGERFRWFVGYYGLSERESQVFAHLLHGYTMAVIGDKMGLSGNTIRTYVRRIYTKTGVGNKQELIALLETQLP